MGSLSISDGGNIAGLELYLKGLMSPITVCNAMKWPRHGAEAPKEARGPPQHALSVLYAEEKTLSPAVSRLQRNMAPRGAYMKPICLERPRMLSGLLWRGYR
jgi:hypothetical protein